MEVLVKLVCIEISLLLLIYGWFLAKITGAWSHPAVIYAVFWSAMTFFPLAAVFSAPANPWAVAYVFATGVAFGLPALCYDWSKSVTIARSRQGEQQTAASPNILVYIFVGLQICTIAFVIINLSIQGYTLADFVTNPLRASNEYLAARYRGDIRPNLFSQTGIISNYVAATIGGLVVAQARSRIALVFISLLAFGPSLLHMIIYADKGTLFLAGAYFFGGVIVARVVRGDTSLINAITVKAGGCAVILVLPFILFAMLSRGGGISKIIFFLNSYAFGHLYAFADWFEHYYFRGASPATFANPESYTYGFWSFIAISRQIFPNYELQPGYFTEYFLIPDVLQSNIYTMFRGLIYDFGLIGSLAFMAIAGLASSLAYNSMLRNRTPAFSQSFYILVITCTYSSYIFSLLTWNSVYVATISILILLLLFNGSRQWSRLVSTTAN